MKKLFKKLLLTIKNVFMRVAGFIFTGIFGKTILLPSFIGYYLTDNWNLRLLSLILIALCVHFNYRGFTLNLSNRKKMKHIKANSNSID